MKRGCLQVPKFVSHDDAEMMYKLVDLQSLAVYCDTNVTMLANLSLQELAVSPFLDLSSLQWLLPLLDTLSVCLLPLLCVPFL